MIVLFNKSLQCFVIQNQNTFATQNGPIRLPIKQMPNRWCHIAYYVRGIQYHCFVLEC